MMVDGRVGECSYHVLIREGSAGMSIQHRIKPRFPSKNHEIVAKLREDAGAGPPMDPYVKVKRLMAQVAVELALIHGGDWRPVIDHENALAVVARRPPPKRS